MDAGPRPSNAIWRRTRRSHDVMSRRPDWKAPMDTSLRPSDDQRASNPLPMRLGAPPLDATLIRRCGPPQLGPVGGVEQAEYAIKPFLPGKAAPATAGESSDARTTTDETTETRDHRTVLIHKWCLRTLATATVLPRIDPAVNCCHPCRAVVVSLLVPMKERVNALRNRLDWRSRSKTRFTRFGAN